MNYQNVPNRGAWPCYMKLNAQKVCAITDKFVDAVDGERWEDMQHKRMHEVAEDREVWTPPTKNYIPKDTKRYPRSAANFPPTMRICQCKPKCRRKESNRLWSSMLLECGRRRLAKTRGEPHRLSDCDLARRRTRMIRIRILPGPPAKEDTVIWENTVPSAPPARPDYLDVGKRVRDLIHEYWGVKPNYKMVQALLSFQLARTMTSRVLWSRGWWCRMKVSSLKLGS